MRMMDDQRVKARNSITMPDQIWIADWDGKANTSSSHIRSTGWQPYSRMKQYRGGHPETWGGVRINIDRNYLYLRTPRLPGAKPAQTSNPPRYTGSSLTDPLCTPKSINRSSYRQADAKSFRATIVTLQCLLKQRHAYKYAVTGQWNPQTLRGLNAFQRVSGHPVRSYVSQTNWMALLTKGASGATLQSGSSGADVIRVQRALNAAGSPALNITGAYGERTENAVGAYQTSVGLPATEIVGTRTWAALRAGKH
jgi:peptidoglycan hydrolase-like protein with peptidoglycan-binding domain